MTANIEQFTSAGVETAYWARNNSAGYPAGATGSLANGSDASMQRLLGIDSINVAVQQPRKVTVTGDDGPQSIFFFEAAELPSGDLVLGVLDVNFIAQAQGTKVYADGDFDMITLQPDLPTYNNMTFITNSQAKSRMSGSSGQAGYMTKIYPKVQAIPLGDAGLSNAAGTTFTHALIANKSDKKPWGASFSLTNDGTIAAPIMGPFYSEGRVCMHTHISDASDLAFTLANTPLAANANKVKAWRNGTALAYTTDFSVSGAVLTLAAAGSAGDVVVARYEY